MKKNFLILLILFSTAIGAKEILLNKIVLMVNGEAVTLFDLKKLVNPAKPDSVTFESIKKSEAAVVEKAVQERLIKQEMTKRNIVIDKEDVEKAIKNVAAQNKISVEKLREEIEKQGVSWEKYKGEMLGEQLGLLKLKQVIAMTTLDVDEALLRSIYKKEFSEAVQYTASHIILKSTRENDADVFSKISQIYSKITDGEVSFEDAAAANSEDGSASNGGKLGTFSPSQMVPEFSEKLATMKDGEMSKPFLTRFGWHIIKLDKVEKKTPPPFDDVKNRIKHMYYGKNQEKAFKSWLKIRRDNSKIEILF